MRTVAVVPARYASVRFPGKPLALINGKPMVQWVYEAARRAASRALVATDDRRIFDFIRGLGGEALMTSSRCKSGTDRVAEAARVVKADLYLNVQGDEPLMHADTLRRVQALHRDRSVAMGTAVTALNPRDWKNPDVVKALVDDTGCAVTFSRAPIPYFRDGAPALDGLGVYKHLGVYSYRAEFLRQFVRWRPSPWEQAEKLEQLRAVQNGVRIRAAVTPHDSSGVDRPADRHRAEAALRSRAKGRQ